jgi:hypothetical protein
VRVQGIAQTLTNAQTVRTGAAVTPYVATVPVVTLARVIVVIGRVMAETVVNGETVRRDSIKLPRPTAGETEAVQHVQAAVIVRLTTPVPVPIGLHVTRELM